MDRRTTLSTLLGKKKSDHKAFRTSEKIASTSLNPYSGPWDFEQAVHLLRRTIYGPNYQQIKDTIQNGLDSTLDTLFAAQPLPAPPLNYNNDEDPNVPIGETWIEAPYQQGLNLAGYRYRSLRAWTVELMLSQGLSIREKMVLFWHNHFVTANVNDPKFRYDYITRIRENALGNFRDFVKKMTIDPSMLRYLNGRDNTNTAPNENYARELLELFTIGKGELAGPGDYTNYTEDDVVEIARVLTGWRDLGFNTQEFNPITAVFVPNRHDTGDKQLSHRFDNVVITNNGDQEYADLIDIIFQKEEVSRFICRKLYRWFVYYNITDEIEQNIIEPMAQILRDNDYNIAPALQALLKSEHFFDSEMYGCMIKNPMDFSMGLFNQFNMESPESLNSKYTYWLRLSNVPSLLQMAFYDPPSVAGWTAYYQEPSYYQLWTNSVTLPLRANYTSVQCTTGINAPGEDNPVIDALAFVDAMDDPFDVNSVIDEAVKILFPKDIEQNQKDFLKEVLIPGLPDFEWNVEYSEYISDPGNEEVANSVRSKIRTFLITMLTMPEYHLS